MQKLYRAVTVRGKPGWPALYGLGAELAAGGGHGDLGLALDADFGSGRLFDDWAFELGHEVVEGQHNEEV